MNLGDLSKEFSMPQEGDPFLSISFEDSNGRSLNSKIPNPRAFKPQLSSDKLKITYKWVSNQNLQIERIFGVKAIALMS